MGIAKIVDQLARIVTNPASNLTGAMLLLAMLVLVLLILSVGALIAILPGADDDEDEDEAGQEAGAAEEKRAAVRPAKPAPASPPRPVPRWLSAGLPAALFIASIVTGWYVTGLPESCGSCHAMAPSLKSWRTGDHPGVSCVACHEGGGAAVAASVVYRASDVVAAMSGSGGLDGDDRPVASYRCERCHAEQLRETVTRGAIRVSHTEFLDRGYECLPCHDGVGHSKSGTPERAVDMNECVTCHDGKTAASSCDTCHVGDPSGAVRLDRSIYPKASIPIASGCRGCHETESCTKCHGIEMPHPAGFEAAKGHASLAAFERKELCWRCHIKQDCRRCHKGDFGAHPQGWKASHPSGIPLDGRNACACHLTPDFCGICHETGKR